MWANGRVMTIRPARAGQLGQRRVAAAFVVAVAGTAALTAVLIPARSAATLSLDAMVFLSFVVGCALLGGRWPAVVAALLSGLSLNYWFTAPLHRLRIAQPENVATIALFLVVAIAVSALVDVAARRAHQAQVARAEADNL